MATMYSLFFGIIFTAVCSGNSDGSSDVSPRCPVMSLCPDASGTVVEDLFRFLGTSTDFIGFNCNRFLCRSVAVAGPVPFLLTKKEPKGQGLVARLNCLLISGNKTNSLRSDKSDCLSEVIDNSLRLAQPRPFYLDSANRSICTMSKNVAFDIFKNLKREAQSIVLKISSDEFLRTFCGKKYEPCHGSSGIKANNSSIVGKRKLIIKTATAELGVREVTGNNDGPRIEEYLAYTHLSKGYEWCAAFVSWCYGQVGLGQPRNPWSPALFPKLRLVDKVNSKPADVFGIYSNTAKRIHHVGLIKELQSNYIISIEGNSNNQVESRRRHLRTIHSVANWID